MSKVWGVSMIGVGGIARTHINALKGLPQARLVAVSSRGADKARAVGTEEGVEFSTDPGVLFRRSDVDVVVITTSSGSHAKLALEAIAAGKHLVIEKPMAMVPEDARRIVDAARKKGVMLSVISQRRFEPTLQTIKRLLDDGAIGKLLLIEAFCPYYRTQEYYDSADWRGTIAEDGGALMNQSIHSVDLMLWLAGPAREVFGRTATQTHKMEAEDLALGVVTFASGALGTIMASTSIRPGFQATINLYGDKGTIKLDGSSVAHWTVPGVEPPAAQGTASVGIASPTLSSHEHHQAQHADIFAALDKGGTPAVTGEDGFRAVELVCGVYRSQKSGVPVKLGSPV